MHVVDHLKLFKNFLCSPVVKTLCFQSKVWVNFLVEELRSHMLHSKGKNFRKEKKKTIPKKQKKELTMLKNIYLWTIGL